jgi:hypothetical protein
MLISIMPCGGLCIELGDSRDPEFPLRWQIAERLLAYWRASHNPEVFE